MFPSGIISGHAPGHLRTRFEELVEATGRWSDPTREELDELRALRGGLWNCTDTAPRSLCDEVDLPAGSTYAQVSRHLRREL